MRHAAPLLAFLLILSGCIESAGPQDSAPTAPAATPRGAGGAIMSALPSNLTLAILRPGTEMALMAVEDGNAVLFNTGQPDSALVTDWATRLGVQQFSVLVVTNASTPFSGGC